MEKINQLMKVHSFILIVFTLFLTACEDSKTNNNSTNTIISNSTETIPDNGRTPLYLEGVSATSNNHEVDYMFDKRDDTYWKSKKGAASDEGIMLSFQNKIFIEAIEIIEAEMEATPERDEIIQFIKDSHRGIMKGYYKAN